MASPSRKILLATCNMMGYKRSKNKNIEHDFVKGHLVCVAITHCVVLYHCNSLFICLFFYYSPNNKEKLPSRLIWQLLNKTRFAFTLRFSKLTWYLFSCLHFTASESKELPSCPFGDGQSSHSDVAFGVDTSSTALLDSSAAVIFCTERCGL